MMIHGPSLALGGGISTVAIIFVMFVLSPTTPDLQIISEPKPDTSFSVRSFLESASPILGSSDASILLIEFGDYQCFYCNKFYHEVEELLIQQYVETGKIQIVFKDYIIIGQDSATAAHATYCAQDQKKYWEFHNTLYDNWTGENNGWASYSNIVGFAKSLDLDVPTFEECMTSSKYQTRLIANQNDAQSLDLSGTPAFLLVGKNNDIRLVPGFYSYDDFSAIIDTELSK